MVDAIYPWLFAYFAKDLRKLVFSLQTLHLFNWTLAIPVIIQKVLLFISPMKKNLCSLDNTITNTYSNDDTIIQLTIQSLFQCEMHKKTYKDLQGQRILLLRELILVVLSYSIWISSFIDSQWSISNTERHSNNRSMTITVQLLA